MPPTRDERARIEKGCPRSLRSPFTWGDCFAYFGNGGDTFDMDVILEFGGKKAQKLLDDEEYDRFIEELHVPACKKLGAAFDAWLEHAHAIVPIAFAFMPATSERDAWGEASAARVDEALALIGNYEDSNPPAAPDAEMFGWTVARLSLQLEDATPDEAALASRLRFLERTYRRLTLTLPLKRLSGESDALLSRGSALGTVLDGAPRERRRALVESLEPWTRLAYLASYAALEKDDVPGPDLVADLHVVLASMPPERVAVASALLAWIAANLVRLTPGSSSPDFRHGALALELLELVHARDGDSEASCATEIKIASGLGSSARAQRIADRALTRWPTVALADPAIAAAKVAGDAVARAALVRRRKAIAAADDVANESASLFTKNKIGKAGRLLERHLQSGGEATSAVINNLAMVYSGEQPGDAALDRFFARVLEGIASSPSIRREQNTMQNFCVLAGNTGRFEIAIAGTAAALEHGLALTPGIAQSYGYSGWKTTDLAAKRRVVAHLEALLPGLVDVGPAFEAVAEMHVQLGDGARALSALRLARDKGHPRFAALKKSISFTPLFGLPAFEALFEETRT